MREVETTMFLVHNYETVDGCHHLHVFKGDRARTRYFLDWATALNKAMMKAKKLGLKEIQIDHPDFPHYFLKVR